DTLTTSYSPTRNMFKVYYKHDFSKQLDLRVDASYRVSDYPTKVNPGREDKRQRYGLTLSYNLNDTWKLRGRLEHTDNASTDAALYSYQRDLVAVSVNAGF
ncbi:MAG: outer membrane beta-barrel protein, partial [Gammaproteobacteria bacterium]|nr:outer membrane beta-barrel protein [Gammaproteobacteria bacterium]